MLTSDSEKIINRLKDALNARSDGQLAKFLGISRQNIGAARKRKDVPTGWIYKVAELTGCSMDWLSFGQGPKTRGDYNTDGTQVAARVASPTSSYGPQDIPESRSDPDATQEIEGLSFGTAVEMLARIHGSADRLLIRAVNANIRAICEAIESRQRERRSAKELEDLKKRLEVLEKKTSGNHF